MWYYMPHSQISDCKEVTEENCLKVCFNQNFYPIVIL